MPIIVVSDANWANPTVARRGTPMTASEIRDKKSLEAWLKSQSLGIAVAIAARAARAYCPLRLTPLKRTHVLPQRVDSRWA